MVEKNKILPLRRVPDDKLKRIPGNPDRRLRPKLYPREQSHRLGLKMDTAFQNILDRDDIDIAGDPSALAPERALVMEVIGSPKNFVKTAARIGLEWLAEEVAVLHGVSEYLDVGRGGIITEDDEDDEYRVDGEFDESFLADNGTRPDETIGTLYLGMPTVASFEKLRKLWNDYIAGKPHPENHSDWWGLFSHLHDIRSWGPRDRIGEIARRQLREERDRNPNEQIRVEVDLWYRGDPVVRGAAVDDFKRLIRELGGDILDEMRLDDIRYHAALVQLPANAVDAVIAMTGPLAVADEIMSIRPQGAFQFNVGELVTKSITDAEEAGASVGGAEIAALIDGWPIENHAVLRGRLDVIELDVEDSLAPVRSRFHGTAMASLILRGDLNGDGPVITRRLKVVPVLAPDTSGYETPPKNKLVLGLIYRAVTELKEGMGEDGPAGSDVLIINHSICDEAFGFSGVVSPWARMLDFLAWKYRVVFVVSAGNVRAPFELLDYPTGAIMRAATPEQRRGAIVRAIDRAKAVRTMFSPAESVNALTVAAAHRDNSMLPLPGSLADPYVDFSAPNLTSGLGHGFGRSVKPDIMFAGGRQTAHPTEGSPLLISGREETAYFGQKVASPDPYGGKLDKARLSSGTSNAAALATRAGLLIADVLDGSELNFGEPWYRLPTAPCVMKALIAHGARWDDTGLEMVGLHTGIPSLGRRKEAVSRSMGYGYVDHDNVVLSDQHRVTLLGQDEIHTGQRHEWRIPLPGELRSAVEFRRIAVTLAWLTPVQANSSSYRLFGLEMVGSSGKSKLWEGVKRVSHQPSVSFSRRGTLIHSIYEGEKKAVPFDENGNFTINVQAVTRISGNTKLKIPYALVVSIQVADTIASDITQSILQRVEAQTRTRT